MSTDETPAESLRISIAVCRRLARSLPESQMRNAAAMVALDFMDELDALDGDT